MHHPPIRKFTVDVVDPNHALTFGLPASFEVMDELYFLDLHDPTQCHFFLTTDLPKDPTPARYTNSEYDESRFVVTQRRPGNPAAQVGPAPALLDQERAAEGFAIVPAAQFELELIGS